MGLRETGGALAARAHGRDDPPLRHLDARRPELRIARQRRRRGQWHAIDEMFFDSVTRPVQSFMFFEESVLPCPEPEIG